MFAMILALGYAAAAPADTLTVSVETTSDTGNLLAKIYLNQESFDKREMFTSVTSPAKPGTAKLEFKGLEPGTYGITLFQDLNKNKELDRDLIGAPTEPFGFSNNPVIKFMAPKFEEFKFEFDGTPKEITIKFNEVEGLMERLKKLPSN